MRTRSSDSSGRGDLTLTVSALGLALAVGGGALIVVSASGLADQLRAPPAVEVPAGQPSETPFVVAPAVRLEADTGSEPSAPSAHRHRGVPVRLVVPALDVDVPVVPIRAPGRQLLPPDDPTVLGWWSGGARPGAAWGSALVTGHTVSSGGGAFDDLETLRGGDLVRVRTRLGRIGYRVTGVTIYRKASLARDAARVFDQQVPGRLVLITCEDWNGTTYLSNAVVFAEPLRKADMVR